MGDECCICYTPDGFYTSCKHCICKRCIIKMMLNAWCNGNIVNTCPLCRKELSIMCYYNDNYFILNYDGILIKIEVDFFSSFRIDGNSILHQRSASYSGGLVWGRQEGGRLVRHEKFYIHHPTNLKSITCKKR